MTAVAIGECEYPYPHPPHLWAEKSEYSQATNGISLWACSGAAKDDDI